MRLNLPLIALVGVSAFVGSATAHASPRRASLRVDTSNLGESGPVIKRRIEERSNIVLREQSVMPASDKSDPSISIVVEDLDGDDPGYELELGIDFDSGPGPSRSAVCKLCTETELVALAEAELHKMVAHIPAGEDPEPVDPAATTSDPDPTAPTPTEPSTDEPGRGGKMGAMGKSGAALIAVGSAGLVAGIVLVALPARPLPDDPLKERYTQPPGFAALGLGAAVAVTGIALLAVDLRRSKRKRERDTAGKFTIRPVASPWSVGLTGRF